MKTRFLIIASLSLAVLLLVLYIQKKTSLILKTGQPAPTFSAHNLQSEQKNLSDFRGKVVLLNFWASTCGPCEWEMPSLNALYQRYESRGFVVVGMSVGEAPMMVVKFLRRVSISFPVLLDEDLSISDRYGTYRIPESYLIDRQGNLVEKISGAYNWNQPNFWTKIENLL